jgi:hypothetical protein
MRCLVLKLPKEDGKVKSVYIDHMTNWIEEEVKIEVDKLPNTTKGEYVMRHHVASRQCQLNIQLGSLPNQPVESRGCTHPHSCPVHTCPNTHHIYR